MVRVAYTNQRCDKVTEDFEQVGAPEEGLEAWLQQRATRRQRRLRERWAKIAQRKPRRETLCCPDPSSDLASFMCTLCGCCCKQQLQPGGLLRRYLALACAVLAPWSIPLLPASLLKRCDDACTCLQGLH